ncbi:hypothetical protein X975_25873, partial [Stegodyphus mimosarum]
MPLKENFIQTEQYEDHKQHLLKRQTLQKIYYDRNARPLKPLKVGDQVYIKEKGKKLNERGKIIEEAERPHSYRIIRTDGRIVERNRRDILKGTNQKEFAMQSNYENESHEDEHVDEPDIPEIPSSGTSNLDVPVSSSAPNRSKC